jgi:pyruvate/2-oxoglutarate dehydrogenase complex dihydrolipoamide dehydrogenase (E3) component
MHMYRFLCMSAEGRGQLVDAHTVEVAMANGGTRKLKAKHILIATGGFPTKLAIPGAVSAALGSSRPSHTQLVVHSMGNVTG